MFSKKVRKGFLRRIREGIHGSTTDTAIFPITAAKLAERLLRSFVLDSEASVMQTYYEELRQKPGFRQDAYEKRDFIYLIANIVVAVGIAGKSDSAFLKMMPYFRKLANIELLKRWPMDHAFPDGQIGDAAEDLAKLILNDPRVNRGLPIRWAQQWLREIGVEEDMHTLFPTLFRVSCSWMLCYLAVAEFLQRVRLVPG